MAIILATELQEHIEKIAADLGCEVYQQRGMPGMMYVENEPPFIKGPTMEVADGLDGLHHYPTIETCYMVMLHELGHVAHGHTQGRPPFRDKTFYFDNGVLKSEAQAWEFALDNALPQVELTEVERKFMWGVCLESYYLGAYNGNGVRWNFRANNQLQNGNRHYVRFKWDDADEYFYSIRDRLKEGVDGTQ